jgi:hypothetical protein
MGYSPERISLSPLVGEYPSDEVKIIEARSRAHAVVWGFGAFIATIVLGLIAFVALDLAKLETSTLREWLQTTVASEVGLIAGLLGTRDRS